MFKIDFSNQVRKFLTKSERQLQSRIMGKIEMSNSEPVPKDAVRVGDYRVLYEIDWNGKSILITRIDKRFKAHL